MLSNYVCVMCTYSESEVMEDDLMLIAFVMFSTFLLGASQEGLLEI